MKKPAGTNLVSGLPAYSPDDPEVLHVVIETPKDSRNKYSYSEDQGIFTLKKVLPAGMDFPYDFGFVPSTRAEDGDPSDALVLMDEPAFPGCLLQCRIIGIIEGKEGKKKEMVRNDRIVAVEKANHTFAHVKHVNDLGKMFERELEQFFVNYREVSGSKYKILGIHGPSEAERRLKDGMRAFKKRAKKQAKKR
jgi:inorganic pyrophosphatase